MKEMLRRRDRALSHYDQLDNWQRVVIYGPFAKKIDKERKLIRLKLKSFNKGTHEITR